MLSHITGAEIQGWLAELIQSWNEVIRPPTEWVLRHMLTIPLHAILDVTVVCPLWIRDYLSTGAILTLPTVGRGVVEEAVKELRSDIRRETRHYPHGRLWTVFTIVRLTVAKVVGTLLLLCLAVVAWPLVLLAMIVLFSIRDDEPILVQTPQARRTFLLSLSPLGYFLVFALVNLVTG